MVMNSNVSGCPITVPLASCSVRGWGAAAAAGGVSPPVWVGGSLSWRTPGGGECFPNPGREREGSWGREGGRGVEGGKEGEIKGGKYLIRLYWPFVLYVHVHADIRGTRAKKVVRLMRMMINHSCCCTFIPWSWWPGFHPLPVSEVLDNWTIHLEQQIYRHFSYGDTRLMTVTLTLELRLVTLD